MKTKLEPILEPKFIGCGTCSPMAKTSLNKNQTIESNYPHFVMLNEKEVKKTKVKNLKCEELDILEFYKPLHGEKYQYQNGEWVLVEQNIGYA